MLPRGQQYKNLLKKTVLTAIFVVSVFLFLGAVFGATPVLAESAEFAGDTFGVGVTDENLDLGNSDIRVIIGRIIRAVLGFLGALTVVIIMWGGFTIMTSSGNEESVNKGKLILRNGVIGLVIVMSAFTITQWVINALQDAINPQGSGTVTTPVFENFSGSGSLGKVVKDHYPFRGQLDVKRNTKIVLTFVEPIDPKSVVEDTNGNGIYGDCIESDQDFSFSVDCDKWNENSLQVFRTAEAESQNKELVTGSVSVLYEGENGDNAHTFVLRPYEYLGDEGQTVRYQTILTDIKKKNGDDAFLGQNVNFYTWEFETDGQLDETPPVILDVYPEAASLEAKNQYIQINFSEAVDPTMVQGLVTADKQPNHIQFVGLDVQPLGEWKITNGYKTVEFHSSEQCGVNSCGEALFCLPTTCSVGECNTDYNVVLRTAALFNDVSFESVPFSGVMDLAGNGFDGNADGQPDGKPTGNTLEELDDPDNYAWSFALENEIDRTSPYIQHISPGIDKEQVVGQEPVKIQFNTRMLFNSLYGITINEYPNAVMEDGSSVEFWSKPDSTNEGFIEDGIAYTKTVTKVLHREFGPNGLDFYYFPQMNQTIRSLNGNCMHPGRGPIGNKNTAPICKYQKADDGTIVVDQNCVAVKTTDGEGKTDQNNDTGCVVALGQGFDTTQADINECISKLIEESPL